MSHQEIASQLFFQKIISGPNLVFLSSLPRYSAKICWMLLIWPWYSSSDGPLFCPSVMAEQPRVAPRWSQRFLYRCSLEPKAPTNKLLPQPSEKICRIEETCFNYPHCLILMFAPRQKPNQFSGKSGVVYAMFVLLKVLLYYLNCLRNAYAKATWAAQ